MSLHNPHLLLLPFSHRSIFVVVFSFCVLGGCTCINCNFATMFSLYIIFVCVVPFPKSYQCLCEMCVPLSPGGLLFSKCTVCDDNFISVNPSPLSFPRHLTPNLYAVNSFIFLFLSARHEFFLFLAFRQCPSVYTSCV